MMTVMGYEEQEQMKHQELGRDILVNYSHWHRFLSDIRRGVTGPSFEEYVQIKNDFDGWSYGRMEEGHSSWKKHKGRGVYPMNEYYE